ncbi:MULTISPECIES: hypothetical protein [Burkholderiaceae]|uniref:hypothetical protein n=1 Tax=Burkholderiaceae TaxID=119060 RepID=UPI001F045117|nr:MULTISPECIES: hypothetical protein [Burkholderiaceae]
MLELRIDEILGLKHPQCFANRRAAYAIPPGNMDLIQNVAGSEFAAQDVASDTPVDIVQITFRRELLLGRFAMDRLGLQYQGRCFFGPQR